jgi:hypothetical protein
VEGSRFSLLEITSGLPDDSRRAYERATERTPRDQRPCVKAAQASWTARAVEREEEAVGRQFDRFADFGAESPETTISARRRIDDPQSGLVLRYGFNYLGP